MTYEIDLVYVLKLQKAMVESELMNGEEGYDAAYCYSSARRSLLTIKNQLCDQNAYSVGINKLGIDCKFLSGDALDVTIEEICDIRQIKSETKMGFVLIKYRDIKMLAGGDVDISAITANLKEINELNSCLKALRKGSLNASPDDVARYDDKRDAIIKKIGFAIIGAPFTTDDAEIFARDRQIDYDEVEIEDKPAVITFNLPQEMKTKIVKAANSHKMNLQTFMIEMIKKNI